MKQYQTFTTTLGVILGGIIGGVIALAITNHYSLGHYFWWLGCIPGGIFGYILVEPETIPAAFAQTWQKTIHWKPNWKYLSGYLICMIALYTSYYHIELMFKIVIFFLVAIIILACIALIASLVYETYKAIYKIIKAIPNIIKTLQNFRVGLYRAIHSNQRLLGLVGACIGTGIGYVVGNAFVGGIIGGLWFLVNLESISKKIIHTLPQK